MSTFTFAQAEALALCLDRVGVEISPISFLNLLEALDAEGWMLVPKPEPDAPGIDPVAIEPADPVPVYNSEAAFSEAEQEPEQWPPAGISRGMSLFCFTSTGICIKLDPVSLLIAIRECSMLVEAHDAVEARMIYKDRDTSAMSSKFFKFRGQRLVYLTGEAPF
jgi:hypothetical protein